MQKSNNHKYARRANALLLLYELDNVSAVANYLHAGRSATYGWIRQYNEFDKAGLIPEPPGRKPVTTTEEVSAHLLNLIGIEPNEYGYIRSRWTSETLAEQVETDLKIPIHASTVRRYLPWGYVGTVRDRPCILPPPIIPPG